VWAAGCIWRTAARARGRRWKNKESFPHAAGGEGEGEGEGEKEHYLSPTARGREEMLLPRRRNDGASGRLLLLPKIMEEKEKVLPAACYFGRTEPNYMFSGLTFKRRHFQETHVV
jgi:hypothetical protein